MDIEDCTVCDKTVVVSLLINTSNQNGDVTVCVMSTASMIARQVSSAVAIVGDLRGRFRKISVADKMESIHTIEFTNFPFVILFL